MECSDVPNLERWVPETLEAVNVPLALTIGPPGSPAAELFYVQIATPEAIRARTRLGKCFFARHYLLVREYDWPYIVQEIEQCVAHCEGETWAEVSLRLSRYFQWEFEDYQAFEDNSSIESDDELNDPTNDM